MTTAFTRQDLEQSFPNLTPKVRAALEEIPRRLTATEDVSQANVEATQGINNATVLTLSANDAFGNERILAHGPGIIFEDNGPGETLVIALANNLTFNGGFNVAFNLLADTNLDLPTQGRVLVDDDFLLGPFANDAAAAAGGVPINGIYRVTPTAGQALAPLAWRQV